MGFSLNLISKYFGSLSAKIVQYIISRGWLSLGQLVNQSNISRLILEQTISVLINHDIVICIRIVKPIPNRKTYLYKNVYRGYPQNIIRILRLPRILNYTLDRFGDIAERILFF